MCQIKNNPDDKFLLSINTAPELIEINCSPDEWRKWVAFFAIEALMALLAYEFFLLIPR